MRTGIRAYKREHTQNIARTEQEVICKKEQRWWFVRKCLDWKEDLVQGPLTDSVPKCFEVESELL
jgi:hypothetical protein